MGNYKKTLIREAVIILSIIGVVILFVILIKLNIIHQQEILTTLRSQKVLLSQSAENLGLLKKDWEIAGQYNDKISSLVPTKDSLVLLQKDFQQLALDSGVTLNFTFGTEKNSTTDDLGYIGFSATADGSKENVVNFLKKIEEKFYSLKIDIIDISIQSNNLIRVLMKGQIFFQTI